MTRSKANKIKNGKWYEPIKKRPDVFCLECGELIDDNTSNEDLRFRLLEVDDGYYHPVHLHCAKPDDIEIGPPH